ncbi:hypothetical protein [Hyphomonas sp.]|uniref:hypothetical protein n=1 Tax=Hyphomonas sp. TaxID=87 RepID=UPI0025BC58A5|nr:hypothetical protein [Hyphomonas sp.]
MSAPKSNTIGPGVSLSDIGIVASGNVSCFVSINERLHVLALGAKAAEALDPDGSIESSNLVMHWPVPERFDKPIEQAFSGIYLRRQTPVLEEPISVAGNNGMSLKGSVFRLLGAAELKSGVKRVVVRDLIAVRFAKSDGLKAFSGRAVTDWNDNIVGFLIGELEGLGLVAPADAIFTDQSKISIDLTKAQNANLLKLPARSDSDRLKRGASRQLDIAEFEGVPNFGPIPEDVA